jgi:hypothetical protein
MADDANFQSEDFGDTPESATELSLAEGGKEAIERLIEKTADDPGAPFAVLDELAELKIADRAAFETLRMRLKKAGCRVSELDKGIAAESGEQSGHPPTTADVLIDLAKEAELFRTPDEIAYADIEINGCRQTYPIKSQGFRRWAARRFYEETDGAPNADAMKAAIGVIEAKALHCDTARAVHVRVGELDGKLYVDLCDSKWRAVEVDKAGWRIVERPAIRFRRYPDMRPLPEPGRNGSIDGLRPLLNVQNDDDFVLTIGYELSLLSGRGPYPVAAVTGEQGTAKSTRSAILLSIVDPRRPALRSLPRSERDLFIAAKSRLVLAFDNVSGMSAWLSDALCRVASGAGFGTRRLYEDDEEALFDGARPIILNGIEDVIERPDLAERAIFWTCELIAEENRRSEEEIWKTFGGIHAAVLGKLLDAVSVGLRNASELTPPLLPRMADFAKWAMACEPALWRPGEFLRAYHANILGAVESVLEASPVAVAVRKFMEGLDRDVGAQTVAWKGAASELLALLANAAGDKAAKSKDWPTNGRALSGRLRRAASFLRRVGIDVDFGREGHARTRQIIITEHTRVSATEDTGKSASAPSASTAKPLFSFDQLTDGADANSPDADANAPDADANLQSADANVSPTVRSNPLKSNGADGADGADALSRTLWPPENEGVGSPADLPAGSGADVDRADGSDDVFGEEGRL